MPADPLVTIALPVYNGADTIGDVARRVLDQDYPRIELLISDNASTDGTQDLCRDLARVDERVRYHRQSHNIGLINNFEWTSAHCAGEYLRWIGDNDEITPDFVSKCMAEFAADERLVLVTTQIEYLTNEGTAESAHYDSIELRSDDPVVRLEEMLRLLTANYQLIDPLYGLRRVAALSSLRHDKMLRGDEVYATKLALAGPWGHVPEVLARRHWADPSAAALATLLDVPRWRTRVRSIIEARRMAAVVDEAGLSDSDTRRAKAAVGRFYLRRHWRTFQRRANRARTAISR